MVADNFRTANSSSQSQATPYMRVKSGPFNKYLNNKYLLVALWASCCQFYKQSFYPTSTVGTLISELKKINVEKVKQPAPMLLRVEEGLKRLSDLSPSL